LANFDLIDKKSITLIYNLHFTLCTTFCFLAVLTFLGVILFLLYNDSGTFDDSTTFLGVYATGPPFNPAGVFGFLTSPAVILG
jgi:hypothetical protein